MMKKRYFIATLMSLIISASFAKTPFQVTTDRTDVFEGETISLRIKADYNENLNNIALKDIEKSFTIVAKSSNSQMVMINGRQQSFVELHLMLMPRQIGELTIPSMQLGQEKSDLIKITVTKDTKRKEKASNNVRIEMSTGQDNYFIQGQIILTVKLIYSSAVVRGELSEPKVTDALKFPVQEEIKYQKEINNKLYHVLEKKYAIFPQKSGDMTLQGVRFEGIMRDDDDEGFNNFGMMIQLHSSGKPINVVADDITLKIDPVPESYKDRYWLPAKKISLTESWEYPGKIKSGDSITRVITTKAQGLTAEQLPEIATMKSNDFMNCYVDQKKLDNKIEPNFVMGQKVDTITCIPLKEGALNFPKIELNWWNLDKKSIEESSLPKKTLTILPNKVQAHETSKPEKMAEVLENKKPEEKESYWKYMAVGLIIVWLLTIIGWFFSKKISKKIKLTPKKAKEVKLSKKSLMKEIESSCKNNNAKLAKKYLLLWAEETWPKSNIMTLKSLSDRVEDPLKFELKELENIIYSDKTEKWQGHDLIEALKNYRPAQVEVISSDEDNDLPPLNLN